MKESLILRKAEKIDIPKILNLYNELIDENEHGFNYPHWIKMFIQIRIILRKKRKELFLAELAGQL